MKIRKQFKFEGAHIVRNCFSERCKKSIHGHSYIVEVFLKSHMLDKGGMVIDFSLLKPTVADIIDSFDHAITLWSGDDPQYVSDMKKHSDRWVMMPVNPSAENYAVLFTKAIHKAIGAGLVVMENGEGAILDSVRVHETATGYAEANIDDITGHMPMINISLSRVEFSEAVINDWTDKDMWNKICGKV